MCNFTYCEENRRMGIHFTYWNVKLHEKKERNEKKAYKRMGNKDLYSFLHSPSPFPLLFIFSYKAFNMHLKCNFKNAARRCEISI